MRYLKTGNLYCFSPPVMLATFIIEVLLAVYVVWRYALTPVTRLAVLILVGLATFQLAEYNVCEGAWGVSSLMWAKIGYVAITMLPPLGLHLATKLAGRSNRTLVATGYASGLLFAAFFLFSGNGIESQQCLGNYVIFQTAPWSVIPYAVYYYGWLIVTVGYALNAAKAMKKQSKRVALYALSVGYMAFILPTTTANVIDPSTIAGIPSIMCGFAVILALVLTFVVLPRYYQAKKTK